MTKFNRTWEQLGEAFARGAIRGAKSEAAADQFRPKWDLLKQTQLNLAASWKTIRSLKTRLRTAREQLKANRKHDQARINKLVVYSGQLERDRSALQDLIALIHRDGGHKQADFPKLVDAAKDAEKQVLAERTKAEEDKRWEYGFRSIVTKLLGPGTVFEIDDVVRAVQIMADDATSNFKRVNALQALLISPETAMREAIVTGRKTITIREGHRDYQCGPVMLCCHLVPWVVQADITSVHRTTAAHVQGKDIRDDGFTNLDDMLEKLRRFYPKISEDSPVTVIRWENVRGALVKE